MVKKIALAVFIITTLVPLVSFGGEPRVASLAPNITEILFAIGLDERRIVAVTDYCDYPPRARNIRKVGSLTTINIEKLVSLAPDYVFSTGGRSSPLNTRLKDAGLNVIVLNAEKIDDICANIITAGRVLGREAQARSVVDRMRARLGAVAADVKKLPARRKVYVEIWDDPIISCGRDSLVDDIVTRAGGINITGGINALYPTVNQEFIIKENPEVMILGYMSMDQKAAPRKIKRRFGWQDIDALKAKGIITDIDPNIFLRAGPRAVDGIEQIYKRLYGNKQSLQ